MPRINVILERSRRHIYLGFWRDNIRELQAVPLLKIGEGEGETSPTVLGFSEVYFQYFIDLGNFTYAVFPIEQEAILKKSYIVKFDSKHRFKSSTPMAPLGENTMRPTAVVLNSASEGQRILLVGGRQDRSSQCYSVAEGKWCLSQKLPLGHNLTTTVCVNWQEKAVFTFIIDAQLTIKSACIDLQRSTWTEHTTENTEEAYWAMEMPQSTHEVDRLHIKSGICMDDKSISIVARGRPKGMV